MSGSLAYIDHHYNDNSLRIMSFEELEFAEKQLKQLYAVKSDIQKSQDSNGEGLHIDTVNIHDGTTQLADTIINFNSVDYPTFQMELRNRLKAVYAEINKRLNTEIRELLPHFNFEEQKESFEKYWEETGNCVAFLIHGSRNVGQDILLDFFLKDNRINNVKRIKSKASTVLNQYTFRHLMETLYESTTSKKDFSQLKIEILINTVTEQLLAKLQMQSVVIELTDWLKFLKKDTAELDKFYTNFWKPLHQKIDLQQVNYELIVCFMENKPLANDVTYFATSIDDSLANNHLLVLPCIDKICETHVIEWIRGHVKKSKYKIYYKFLYRELFINEVNIKAIIEEEEMSNHKEFHDYIYEMFKYKCLLTFQH
jgi:hypothetical protein